MGSVYCDEEKATGAFVAVILGFAKHVLMPRTSRVAPRGMVFHVLNRGVGGTRLFDDDDDRPTRGVMD